MLARFPSFLVLCFAITNFLYLMEVNQTFKFSTPFRSLLFCVVLALSWFLSKFSVADALKDKSEKKYWFFSIFALCFLLLFEFFRFIPMQTFPMDEFNRLSYARAIEFMGVPASRNWFIAGAKGIVGYYNFTEYLTVCIHGILGLQVSLHSVYFYLIPFLIRVCMILLVLSFASTIEFSEGKVARRPWSAILFYLGLSAAIFVILIPNHPYKAAIWHLSFRETSLAFLLILLGFVLIAQETAGIEWKKINSFYLSALIPGLLVSVKALTMFPFFVGFSLSCAVIFWFHPKAREKIIYTVLLAAAFVVVSMSFHPVFIALKSAATVDPWFIWRRNGPGWIWPGSPHRLFSLSVALGWLFSLFCLLGLFCFLGKKKLIKFSPLLFFMTGIILSGGFLGLTFRFVTQTGGAEAYWLLAAWFAATLLVIFTCIVLKHLPVLYGMVFLGLIGYGCWLSSPYIQEQSENAPESIHTDDMFDFCLSHRGFPDPTNPNRFAIAHPWTSGTDVGILSAMCDFPTVTNAVSPDDGIFRVISGEPEFSISRDYNRRLTENNDPCPVINEYLSLIHFEGLYIIREHRFPVIESFKKYHVKQRNGYDVYGPIGVGSCRSVH